MPCTDTCKPERYTEKELNHLRKAMLELGAISPGIQRLAWLSLPESLRMEYNWTKWKVRN